MRLVLRWCDEMTFIWSSVPGHGPPRVLDAGRPLLRRWVDTPSVTCWYSASPPGWRADPARTLDAEGREVRAFVDRLTAEQLLAICRRDAKRRMDEAACQLFGCQGSTEWVRNVRHGRELEVAALSIQDPQVRRTALRMRLAWTGSSGELIAAAYDLRLMTEVG